MQKTLGSLAVTLLLAACAHSPPATQPAAPPQAEPTAAQLAEARQVGMDAAQLTALLNKPLYQMQPAEVGRFLAFEQLDQPSLRQRVAALARKNIGQPYELFLLGEFPYETYDAQPLFDLSKSDCVVFAEHTYAMALSASWEEFFWMLQRIRYRDGVIGTATRNHYTEADWNIANRWLVQDVTATLGAPIQAYRQRIDRQAFLKKQFKIQRDIPVQNFDDVYVAKRDVAAIEAQLQDGDFVNIISSRGGESWASHVGLIVTGADGSRHLLHSAEPQVREETLQGFIARMAERDARQAGQNKAQLAGFKFLRLNEAPEVPPMAPQPRPTRPF
ncbi:N-acetylmuramoyl-L-alanine amidase-like domain-containing protein [Pelomonas sp. Root1217]|uniref:N-acetylmuramoyl-L-alanine amidase-like domain-containing protein n=1 Tax=Pelomonas sp. Root1217 TaxID=1736430 RepID=UPI000A461ABB|nr:N-acetylmuramoyl-L-alanine amidase-like domain-containing protein [Pelomonas sp. Root1217]